MRPGVWVCTEGLPAVWETLGFILSIAKERQTKAQLSVPVSIEPKGTLTSWGKSGKLTDIP